METNRHPQLVKVQRKRDRRMLIPIGHPHHMPSGQALGLSTEEGTERVSEVAEHYKETVLSEHHRAVAYVNS